MSLGINDAAYLALGFSILDRGSDGGGLDEGWEELEDKDDELEGFEVEDEDGVLVEDDEEDDDEEWFDDYYDDDDYWEDDDGPESTSEAEPE